MKNETTKKALRPSAASLAEMPEADFDTASVRPNRYAKRAAAALSNIQYGKRRPRKGKEVGPTPTRSLRLPEPIWKALELEAQKKATTIHALIRELVITHVSRLQESSKVAVRENINSCTSYSRDKVISTEQLPTLPNSSGWVRRIRMCIGRFF